MGRLVPSMELARNLDDLTTKKRRSLDADPHFSED